MVQSINMLHLKWKKKNPSKSCTLNKTVIYESIRMLKLQYKMSNRSKCCNLNKIVWINQNVEIWVQNALNRWNNLKFDRNSKNRSKCWNLSAQYQNVKMMKMLQCEWKSRNQSKFCNTIKFDEQYWNLWSKRQESIKISESIKMLKFLSIKMLQFEWKSEFWVQNVKFIRML